MIIAMSLPVLGARRLHAPDSGRAVQQSPLPAPVFPTPEPTPAVIMTQPNMWSSWLNTGEITVEFAGALDRQAIAQRLSIEPPFEYDLFWDAQTLHVVRQSPLIPGAAYVLTIRDMLDRSVAGSPPPDFHLTFVAPDVVYISNSTSDERGSEIVFSFGYSMDRKSVEKALRIEPATPGTWRWSADNLQLIFKADAPFAPDATYRINFDGELRDQDGNPLTPPPPHEFVTGPAIISKFGSQNERDPFQPIRLEFDRPMDWESVASALSIHPVLPLDISWQDNTLFLLPIQGYFDEFTDYTFTLGTTARDATGQAILREPYTWRIQTTQYQQSTFLGYGPRLQILDADGRRAIQFYLQNNPQYVNVTLYRLSTTQFLDHYASTVNNEVGWTNSPMPTEQLPIVAEWRAELSASSDQTPNSSTCEVFLPADLAVGIYLLELGAGPTADQLVVLLTHNVITIKQDEQQIDGWVTNINGRTVTDARITLYGEDGKAVAARQSDAHGLFHLPTSSARPLIVLAQVDGDITAVGFANAWRSRSAPWPLWWKAQPPPQRYTVYTYTDRPLYQPGDTLYFKAVFRQDEDGVLRMPPPETVPVVSILDAENHLLQSQELAADEFGAIRGEFTLSDETLFGDYVIEVAINDEVHRQLFRVEGKSAANVELSVQTRTQAGVPSNHFVKGDVITVVVNARYKTGEPVANGQITLNQYLAQPAPWQFEANPASAWYAQNQPIKGKTDASGAFTTTFTTGQAGSSAQKSQLATSLRYDLMGLEAIFEDLAHPPVRALTAVKVDNGAEIITIATPGHIQRAGQPIPVQIAVKTLMGEPLPQHTLNLILIRKAQDAPDNMEGEETQRLMLKSDNAGVISTKLTIEQPGYYEIRAVARSALLYEVSARTWLWVVGDENKWPIHDGVRLHIVADQDEYAVGESARFAIESPMAGPALLTFERGRTRRAEVIELTPPLTLIERTIQAEDTPNVFVSVSAWSAPESTLTKSISASLPDATLFTDQVEVAVPLPQKQLAISIQPDQNSYAPGSKATFAVHVADANGAPVVAELALAVVEDDQFLIGEGLTGSIFHTFYGPRPHGVVTYDGLVLQRWLFGFDGINDPGAPVNLHVPGLQTILWLPDVRTAINGQAVVTVTLPARTAKLRLTATATTGDDTLVGDAFIRVDTQ
ncbi:MAG: MG2 domain-containing protein [Caldilineaceae bacterium]